MNSKTEGKRFVYNAGLILNLFSLCLQVIAMVTPYWFQSWPRIYSPFKKIGMWEVCLAGLIIQRDPTQKAYHGCWWMLSKEFSGIRQWLMPWWFILTQIAVTVCLLLQIINCIMGVVLWFTAAPWRPKRYRIPMSLVQGTTVITIIEAIVMSCTVILFGTSVYMDRVWMPRPDLNYLSWSYGLEVVGAFFLIFSSMAHIVFNRIIRQEYREPPSLTTPMMSPKDSAI